MKKILSQLDAIGRWLDITEGSAVSVFGTRAKKAASRRSGIASLNFHSVKSANLQNPSPMFTLMMVHVLSQNTMKRRASITDIYVVFALQQMQKNKR